MSKIMEIKEGKLVLGYDADQDGAKSAAIELNLSEALSEAFMKGESKYEGKVVNFKMEGVKLVVLIDSDKDGEHLLKVEIDLAEGFDEVSKSLKKE